MQLLHSRILQDVKFRGWTTKSCTYHSMSFLNGQQTSNLGLMVPRPSLGASGMNGQIQQGHYRSSDDGLVGSKVLSNTCPTLCCCALEAENVFWSCLLENVIFFTTEGLIKPLFCGICCRASPLMSVLFAEHRKLGSSRVWPNPTQSGRVRV